MFTEIKGKEIAIMANVIRNGYVDENGETVEGKSLEETLETMELIDDLLAGNNILSEGIRLYRTKYKTEIISAI